MSINSIENQTKPNVSQKIQSSDSIDSLQRQQETLKRQLKSVKERPKHSQAEQNAAVAQKRILEKRISEIDEKIQIASQSENVEIPVHTDPLSLQAVSSMKSKNSDAIQLFARNIDEYVHEEEFDVSTGLYQVTRDEEGNLKIIFDDPGSKIATTDKTENLDSVEESLTEYEDVEELDEKDSSEKEDGVSVGQAT